MKVSVSPRRISRRVTKSVGILFILALVVLAYAATPLTAFASRGRPVSGGGGDLGGFGGGQRPPNVPPDAQQAPSGIWYWCDPGYTLYLLNPIECLDSHGKQGAIHSY